MTSLRGWIAAGILAAWGAGIAALAQRELSRSPSERLALAAVRVSPVASYFTLRRGERHAGFSSFTTDTVPDGLLFTDYTVSEDDQGRRGVRQVVVRSSRLLALREIVIGQGVPVATAMVRDSTLTLVQESGGQRQEQRMSFSPPLLVPALVPTAVALSGPPDVGDRASYDVFDPALMAVRRLGVSVRAESTWVVVDSAAWDGNTRRWTGVHADTVRAWHVVDEHGTVNAWVDEQGRLVAGTNADGMSTRRTAYELAFENWRSAGRERRKATNPDTVSSSAPAAVNARRLDTLRVLLLGLPLDRLHVSSDWQKASGDTVLVTRPLLLVGTHGYWLPPQRDFRAEHAKSLQVGPGLEVEAPLIVATAKRLRAREPNPGTVARVLVRWVADSVALDDVFTPPSALATLRSRRGSAAHHVHLFVALARAAGIPARPVRGLVASGPDMLSHVWAEVWLGSTWLPVDPTRGELPASASHLRLLVGGVEVQAELERLVSRATRTVLTASPASDAR